MNRIATDVSTSANRKTGTLSQYEQRYGYSCLIIRCRHKCCKRALASVKTDKDDTPPIIGTKRPSPENENTQPPSKRRAHASPSSPLAQPAEPSAVTTSDAKTTQKDLFDYFPQLSEKGD